MVPSFRPAVQQSGTGGTFNLPSTANMTVEGEFGTVPVGAPVFGHDTGENGDHIWYFDGTPAATVRILNAYLFHIVRVHRRICIEDSNHRSYLIISKVLDSEDRRT